MSLPLLRTRKWNLIIPSLTDTKTTIVDKLFEKTRGEKKHVPQLLSSNMEMYILHTVLRIFLEAQVGIVCFNASVSSSTAHSHRTERPIGHSDFCKPRSANAPLLG